MEREMTLDVRMALAAAKKLDDDEVMGTQGMFLCKRCHKGGRTRESLVHRPWCLVGEVLDAVRATIGAGEAEFLAAESRPELEGVGLG